MVQFPSNFFWGSATSSYQVEGNNSNADWWAWEKKVGKEQSAQACKHYELYEADFDLAKSLNHNAHRLSIEWARIEPQEGEFSSSEMQHYVAVILALRKRGIEPMVTLHHFTNPIWLAELGGWENARTPELFVRYSEYVVRALGQHVSYWMTINEPTIFASHAYIFGWWPPQKKSVLKAKNVQDNLVLGHIKTYRMIHKVYKESNLQAPSVGIAHHIPAMVTCNNTLRNRLAVRLRDWSFSFGLLDTLMRHKSLDFIGLNYYSRQLVETNSWWITNLLGGVCQQGHHPVKKNSLGWDIYPEGLYHVLLKLKKYQLPVIITENGICTENVDLRWEFIEEHLKKIHQAIQEGVDIRGYLYWSLLDNFEWDKGFGPRFGLINMDYANYQRTVKQSAIKFGQVCKTGQL